MQRATFDRPRLMPKAFWRRVVWIRNVYWGIYGVGMLIWALFLGWRLALVGMALAAGALFVWGIAPRVAKRRMLRQLQDGDYCLCLDCGYCLKGLPARHTCPECATAFDIERVQEAWHHWVDHNRLPQDVVQSETSIG